MHGGDLRRGAGAEFARSSSSSLRKRKGARVLSSAWLSGCGREREAPHFGVVLMSFSALIAVFEEARLFLSLPENDFSWSSWEGADDALREVDDVLSTLRSGGAPRVSQMQVLFAPTG